MSEPGSTGDSTSATPSKVRQRRKSFSSTQEDTPEEKRDEEFINAVKAGDEAQVQVRLAAGQLPDVADDNGDSAVHHASTLYDSQSEAAAS